MEEYDCKINYSDRYYASTHILEMTVTVANHKDDQTGEGLGIIKHLFANPMRPQICPNLSLALYGVLTDLAIMHPSILKWEQNWQNLKCMIQLFAYGYIVDAALKDIGTHSNTISILNTTKTNLSIFEYSQSH